MSIVNPCKTDKTDKNNDSKNQVDETNNNYASSSLQVLKNNSVLLQTARADVYSTDKKFTKNVRILFDNRAQLNYISPHPCQELQLILFTKKEISIKTFGKGIS